MVEEAAVPARRVTAQLDAFVPVRLRGTLCQPQAHMFSRVQRERRGGDATQWTEPMRAATSSHSYYDGNDTDNGSNDPSEDALCVPS